MSPLLLILILILIFGGGGGYYAYGPYGGFGIGGIVIIIPDHIAPDRPSIKHGSHGRRPQAKERLAAGLIYMPNPEFGLICGLLAPPRRPGP